MKEPAVAPAAPKHANVESVGYVPGVLICNNGSKLKFLLNQLAYVYFDLWYTEKEIVRTRVTLANGAVTPRKKPRIFSVLYVRWTQSTKLWYLYVCMRVLTESRGNYDTSLVLRTAIGMLTFVHTAENVESTLLVEAAISVLYFFTHLFWCASKRIGVSSTPCPVFCPLSCPCWIGIVCPQISWRLDDG